MKEPVKKEKSYSFYSNLLNQVFNTVEDLEKAEKEYKDKHSAELKLKENRKADAKKVEEAYKKLQEAQREAQAIIRKAEDNYIKERDAFIEKYHSYHLSYTNNNGVEDVTISDVIDSFMKAPALIDFFGRF